MKHYTYKRWMAAFLAAFQLFSFPVHAGASPVITVGETVPAVQSTPEAATNTHSVFNIPELSDRYKQIIREVYRGLDKNPRYLFYLGTDELARLGLNKTPYEQAASEIYDALHALDQYVAANHHGVKAYCHTIDGCLGQVGFSCMDNNEADRIRNILSDYPKMMTLLQQKIEQIPGLSDATSDREKVQILSKWMRETFTYDKDYLYKSVQDSLTDGKVVCMQDAIIFKMACDLCKIPCDVIDSEAMKHAWNAVVVDGQKLYVDITGHRQNPDRYLLEPEELFMKNHY